MDRSLLVIWFASARESQEGAERVHTAAWPVLGLAALDPKPKLGTVSQQQLRAVKAYGGQTIVGDDASIMVIERNEEIVGSEAAAVVPSGSNSSPHPTEGFMDAVVGH